jgi:glycosyltransferase involved in cell wall biosynthesis
VASAIEAGGLGARFHLLPPQPDGELLAAASDVVCLATRTPDPFPRTVLEAMAAGRPVVAFRSGGVAELVRDGESGLLVAPGDLDGLADGFVRLGEDAALRAALGRAGARRVRDEFSLERHLDRMEALFRSLVR